MKRFLMALLTCLVIAGVSGCGGSDSGTAPADSGSSQAAEEAADEEG